VADHQSYDRMVAVCKVDGQSIGDMMRAAGVKEGGRAYPSDKRRTAGGTRMIVAEIPTSPSARYKSCTEARAAGAAPLYRGQPGYNPNLDRDNDGVACEPYRGR
jgi:endonuclease YncB( thermonuclease family)